MWADEGANLVRTIRLNRFSPARPTMSTGNSSENPWRAALLGSLAGGAVGLAVGLLIAPERGERARRRLAYQLDRVASQLGDYVDKWGEGEEYSEARRSGAEVVDEAKAQAEQILNDANTLLEEVKRHQEAAEREMESDAPEDHPDDEHREEGE